MQLNFAQVGASPVDSRTWGKEGHGLCSRAEQHNVDRLGRGGAGEQVKRAS